MIGSRQKLWVGLHHHPISLILGRYEKARFRGGLSRVSKGRQLANKVSEQAVVVYTPSSPVSAGLMRCWTSCLPSLRPLGIIYVAALASGQTSWKNLLYVYTVVASSAMITVFDALITVFWRTSGLASCANWPLCIRNDKVLRGAIL